MKCRGGLPTLPLLLLVVLGACSPGPSLPAPSPAPTSVVHVLRVLVLGADGPLGGTRVCAIPLSGETRCADTGAEGRAAIAGVPGTYFVRLPAPEGQRAVGDPVAVDLFGGDASVTVRFERIRSIRGAVQGVSGAVVAAARVCAHPLVPGATVCAKSDAAGHYRLEAPPGLWKIEVDGPPGGRLLGQWARGRVSSGEADVIDPRTEDVSGVDITLVGGVVLRGQVTGDDLRPIKAAQVCTKTLAAPLPWDCERTDAHGRYAALREPGRYYVWTIPPDDEPLVPQWFANALTGVGATAIGLDVDDTLDVTLHPGPSIRGRVTDATGAPVAGSLVCVDTPFPTGRICRPADLDGAYRVTTRSETYLIQVFPPTSSDAVGGFWGGGRSWLDARTVSVGSRDVSVDIVLEIGVRLSGIVRSAGGIPLEGATLDLADGRGAVAATSTDEAGRYVLAAPPGTYTLDVFAPFPSSVQSVTGRSVDLGTTRTLDVVLPDAAP